MKVLKMSELPLAGKRVLIREDLNVPVADGVVSSDARRWARCGPEKSTRIRSTPPAPSPKMNCLGSRSRSKPRCAPGRLPSDATTCSYPTPTGTFNSRSA